MNLRALSLLRAGLLQKKKITISVDSEEPHPLKAVSHCITWFQTQLILTTCQIRYHSHLWDHRSTGQL